MVAAIVAGAGSNLSPGFSASLALEQKRYAATTSMNGRALNRSAPARPGCWLMRRRMSSGPSQLAIHGQLGEARVESHFDVPRLAEPLAGRELNADGVHRGCALSQDSVLEGKLAHQVHALDETVAGDECKGVRRGCEYMGSRELPAEAG